MRKAVEKKAEEMGKAAGGKPAEKKEPVKKGSTKKSGEKELQRQMQELKETLQRVQADFENSCKRTQREKEEFREHAKAAFVKELLPLLDSMQAAGEKLEKQENVSKDDAVKGIGLLHRQLLAMLQCHGLHEIKAVGEQFDPMLHEAMMQGSDAGRQDGTVLEEFQKGYMLGGRVLRHAKVKVNKRSGKREEEAKSA